MAVQAVPPSTRPQVDTCSSGEGVAEVGEVWNFWTASVACCHPGAAGAAGAAAAQICMQLCVGKLLGGLLFWNVTDWNLRGTAIQLGTLTET